MAKSVTEILSNENPVFSSFIVYSSILIIKMLFMGFLTNFFRIKNKVLQNIVWKLNELILAKFPISLLHAITYTVIRDDLVDEIYFGRRC